MDLELLRANLVRTFVPLLVGALTTLLPFMDRVADNGQMTALIGFGVSYVYYSVIRVAETRHPQLGILLGKRMNHGAPSGGRVQHPVSVAPQAGSAVIIDGRPLTGVTSAAWRIENGTPTVVLELTGVDVALTVRTESSTEGAEGHGKKGSGSTVAAP